MVILRVHYNAAVLSNIIFMDYYKSQNNITWVWGGTSISFYLTYQEILSHDLTLSGKVLYSAYAIYMPLMA